MLKDTLAVLTIFILFIGCTKSKTQTCNAAYDACAFKAPASEIQDVQNYLTQNGITATPHCSGFFYRIDMPGTGATPNVCSNVAVTYEGRLTNGNVFEARTSPIAFNLSGVITGWTNGIPLIKEGGRIYLYLPPSLAYGSATVGSIPSNSILIFKVELVSVLN